MDTSEAYKLKTHCINGINNIRISNSDLLLTKSVEALSCGKHIQYLRKKRNMNRFQDRFQDLNHPKCGTISQLNEDQRVKLDELNIKPYSGNLLNSNTFV